ncbi:MAG: hypothetical protein ACPIOQ_16850, partial [Promethearchaeia archaeon]
MGQQSHSQLRWNAALGALQEQDFAKTAKTPRSQVKSARQVARLFASIFVFFHFQSEKARGTGAAFAPRCDASAWNDIGITVCDCLTCLYLISDGASFLLHLSRLPRCSHTHTAAHSAFAFQMRLHHRVRDLIACLCLTSWAWTLKS